MINFYSKSIKSAFHYSIFALILAVSLTACKTDEIEVTPASYISVFNASPTAATYDVYLSDVKFNSAALPFGGGTTYTAKPVGNYNIKLTVAGRIESLITKSVNLAENKYYSYYFIDRPNVIDGLLVSDDLSATTTDKAFVRFINLSPDASSLDLVTSTGTSVATDKAFKQNSAFIQIATGATVLVIKDKATGITKSTLESFNFVTGGYYTVIARGLLNPASTTENSFSGQVILHK
ncbi:MAG: DUF4397 domain-containing protein [Flavobacterium sp.]|nr:MAG: DUF4397 domain-containing protein [Flavobacterium sp.]